MSLFHDPGMLSAFAQVVMIDLVLAGDNAVVIGLAAAGLPSGMRRKAILYGIAAATVMRIGLAIVTVQLLEIIGLLLAGGILLLWVCWKMFQEIRHHDGPDIDDLDDAEQAGGSRKKTKTFKQAILQIIIADISMSLDNVLAVAGAAYEHPVALAFGLVLSIALMGLAANFIARLLNKHRWIAYIGLLIILVVALRMIWEGSHEVMVTAGVPMPDIPVAAGLH